jgi:23S rRNA (cytosine1962-C5)-methyltransferase
MRVWHVRKGAEAKVRRGYPWLFSNELAHSPKEAEPGEPIELRDHTDVPLAFGYGHPHSLIAFRSLSAGAAPEEGLTQEFLLKRLQRAHDLRRSLGLASTSHRLCFAEADGLPGLVIDRYRLDATAGASGAPDQVLAVQVSTAAMERALPLLWEALKRWVDAEATAGGPAWDRTAILLDQGSSSRALEELPVLPKVWHQVPPGPWDGSRPTPILVSAGIAGTPQAFLVDFLGGQKTGFFLDHRLNLGLAADLTRAWLTAKPGGTLKILDLFCYVGQWGAVLARAAGALGVSTEVLAVDASERALDLAARNISGSAGQTPLRVHTQRGDILDSMEGIPGGHDIVIVDPPALVKRRKDLPKGERAYGKLNREALRRVRPGGLIVTCSCSGLLGEDEFRDALQRAQVQAGRSVQWVVRGGQGLDHPVRAEFPEGRYLKCWMGIVE